jgi:lipopolysaccharide/colanic/teichoic acid biosynthesis glycosyltransferase
MHRVAKRVLDILGAGVGLLLMAPLAPFIILAIKGDSHGPALIRLSRISAGKKIHVYKFRSMIDGAHAMKPTLLTQNERSDGPFFKIRHDPRVTKVGRVLRRFRLDEFPQLINVMTGDLSLVGPRPHEPEEVIHYPGEFQHLILAKAGVTGLSQVSGASSLPFMKELELDSFYVKNPSLLMDAKILGKTFSIIFTDPTAV